MKQLAYLFSLLLICACVSCSGGGDSSSESSSACDEVGAKIVNGEGCSVGNSAIVRLVFINDAGGEEGLCSGTAVSTTAIVTAAHCFDGSFSSIRVDTGNGSVAAQSYTIHPGYSGSDTGLGLYHDVAVVVTASELPTRAYPVLTQSNATVGEEAIIAGYGYDENGGIGSLIAGYAVLQDVTDQEIGYVYDGSTGANTCQGDSGGPLLVKRGSEYVLAGVTSTGTADDCGVGDVSLYTNLANSSNAHFLAQNAPGLAVR